MRFFIGEELKDVEVQTEANLMNVVFSTDIESVIDGLQSVGFASICEGIALNIAEIESLVVDCNDAPVHVPAYHDDCGMGDPSQGFEDFLAEAREHIRVLLEEFACGVSIGKHVGEFEGVRIYSDVIDGSEASDCESDIV